MTSEELRACAPRALGQSLAIHRKLEGWTEEEAAEKIGVTLEQLQSIEAGDLQKDVNILRGIADTYGIKLSYLKREYKLRAGYLNNE